MKIVIITPYYAPAWAYGGPPKVLSILAGELVKSGHRVTVITTDALDTKRNSKRRERIDGVDVYRFPTISNFLAYHQKIFFVPHLLRTSKKVLDEAQVVLFSDVRSILNWQLIGYVRMRHIPYGVFAFGQIPYDAGWKRRIKQLFDILWVRRFVRYAMWRFAQTNHERDMYVRYFNVPKAQTHLLLLPIKPPLRRNRDDKKEKIILFVGRFHYLKGVDILIKSCIPLLRSNSALKLVLIGRNDGSEAYFRSLVPVDLKHSIIFPGAVYGSELSFWYRRASCFAFTPRYFEETSTAALEALSHGCPVVTVLQSEIPFLAAYNAGAATQNTTMDIRRGLERVLRNTLTMGKQAQRLIRDHYEVSKVAHQLLLYITYDSHH